MSKSTSRKPIFSSVCGLLAGDVDAAHGEDGIDVGDDARLIGVHVQQPRFMIARRPGAESADSVSSREESGVGFMFPTMLRWSGSSAMAARAPIARQYDIG